MSATRVDAAVLLAIACLLGGCASTAGGAADPALVGRYEWWGIDSGAYLELAADGSWTEGDVGMGAMPLRWCGRWAIAGDRLRLELDHTTGWGPDPSVRQGVPASVASTYPRFLRVGGSGPDTVLEPVDSPRVPWRRVPARRQPPRAVLSP